MPTPLTLLKNLSYPFIATTSAGSGALIMYFAKPEADLKGKQKKWNEDKQKLRSEIDELKKESKSIEGVWNGRLEQEQKSAQQLVNFNLTIYGAKVTQYTNCLDRLFDKISSRHLDQYDDKARVSECGKRPAPTILEED